MCRSIGEPSPASSTSNEHASDQRSPSAGAGATTDAKGKERRVPLACLRCRAKRVRCSGIRPRCKACEAADVDCQWPEGRRRKRTRKEMEEAERQQRETAAVAVASKGQPILASASQEIPPMLHRQQHDVHFSLPWNYNGRMEQGPAISPTQQASSAEQWYTATPANPSYIWPPQDPSSSTIPGAQSQNSPAVEAASEILADSGVSPASNEQLMRALESQTAFVERDPDSKEDLELYYYRLAGSTAIHPGINRISLKLQARPPLASSAPVPSNQKELPAPPWPDDLFDENSMPLPSVHLPLIDTFFCTMSQHFPSLSRRRLKERLETGTMSAFYLNLLRAIYYEGPGANCSFIASTNTRQRHRTSLVSVGLLWSSEKYDTSDRIISFSTGRPASIPEDVIEIPLPSDDDFFPDPARNTDLSLHEPVEPIPFVYLVRAMVLVGRISAALNGQRGRSRTLVGVSEVGPEVLSGLQSQLVQFYASLPDPMKWSVDNFKHQESRGHGGSFLTLHLWTNAVMALVYHPELTTNPSGVQAPLVRSLHCSMKLSLSSSRNISECLVFADLFSSKAYLGNPFSVQPIFVACLAFLHEIKRNTFTQGPRHSNTSPTETNEPPSAEQFMSSMARQNLTILTKALQRMEQYWAGIAYVLSILLQRVAGKDLPHNTAPATDTSLSKSIEEDEKQQAVANSSFSVQDLLSAYNIEDLFVTFTMLDFHPRYNHSDGDIILSSSDGVLFCVHSIILKLVSGVFKQMLEIPRVASENSDEPIPLSEDGKTIALLLDAVYPHYDGAESVRTFEEAWAVTRATEKYDMPSALESLRTRISRNPHLRQHAVQLYALACHCNWEDIIKTSAENAANSDIVDVAHRNRLGLKDLTIKDLLNLLHFRRRRIDALIHILEGRTRKQISFSIDNFPDAPWICPCNTTVIDSHKVENALSTLFLAFRGVLETRNIHVALSTNLNIHHAAGFDLWNIRCEECHCALIKMDNVINAMEGITEPVVARVSWERAYAHR
ncbi:hypothetical protein A7U60_g5224 [Sanghuangporus baumii]|uniref:Zn(2)-C6 fungal-type domain-containing protein n=1 Tax=Sanghuangporus baumii TaxID=108892 RepID=A0A9Q5HX87_SANBA|nr:hypothetical protein A7U60_g5224 [Sanghuangporus baumii]